jgi:hypothetical protein
MNKKIKLSEGDKALLIFHPDLIRRKIYNENDIENSITIIMDS